MPWILKITHKDGYVSKDRYTDEAEMRMSMRLALKDKEVTKVESVKVD